MVKSMKRIIALVGLVSLVMIMLIIFMEKKFNPDYTVGVVKTKWSTRPGSMLLYDDDLNFVQEKRVNVNDLGYSKDIGDGKIYSLGGEVGFFSKPKIMEFDKKTGKSKVYVLEKNGNNAIAVSEKYLFSVMTTMDSHISRYNRQTEKFNELIVPGVIIDEMNVFDDKLYAFGGDSHTLVSNFYIINPDSFKIEETYDVKDKGFYQEHMLKIGDDLYFTNTQLYKPGNHGEDESTNTLTKFNIITKKFTDIKLDRMRPAKFVQYGNKLLITYNDGAAGPFKMGGNFLTVYDIETGKQSTFDLKHQLRDIVVSKYKLFARDDYSLYRYDLQTLKEEKSVALGTRNKNNWYVATDLFVKD